MQVLPYDAVWRTKIELYMGRLENAVLDAARAGYASRAPTWTMAGALLYSASLTTLVGKMYDEYICVSAGSYLFHRRTSCGKHIAFAYCNIIYLFYSQLTIQNLGCGLP